MPIGRPDETKHLVDEVYRVIRGASAAPESAGTQSPLVRTRPQPSEGR
jgi:hypothetical protein